MNKKTRFFMLASTLVLAVGLCTGLLAYYGGLPTLASSRDIGPDELKYVPSNAAVVAFANVRDVMASEFRQSLRTILPDHDKHGQDEFQRETGIDVEQDLDHVVACMLTTGGAQGQGHAGFVMLRGRFDAGRLEGLATQKGGQVEDVQGTRVVRLKHGDGSAVLAFVEPGLLMFGDEPTVKAALLNVGEKVTANEELMGMIADVETSSSNMWAVGRIEALGSDTRLPDAVKQQLHGVKWFSASSRINGGLSGILRAEARDDEGAKNLREVVQGFLALAKMQTGNKPEMQTLVQSVQLSGTGRTVALSFQVPSEFIQAMTSKGKPALD